MRQDSRLSVALHVLLHLGDLGERGEPVSSEQLGEMLKANPVVLRRTLGGLRDAGIVSAEKGHGGGWAVARKLESVTLAEVFDAIGHESIFGIGVRDEHASCPIERAVNHAVGSALSEAEARFKERLSAVHVSDLLTGARHKLAAHKKERTCST